MTIVRVLTNGVCWPALSCSFHLVCFRWGVDGNGSGDIQWQLQVSAGMSEACDSSSNGGVLVKRGTLASVSSVLM